MDDESLIELAKKARAHAYVPYSGFAVGAAALAIVADGELPCSPCGACRQVIAEFAVERIILANLAGKRRVVTKEELLPFAFTLEEKSLPSD